MSIEMKNLHATAHNTIICFDALKGSGECRGWGGEKWAKFCDKMEDLRAALVMVSESKPTASHGPVIAALVDACNVALGERANYSGLSDDSESVLSRETRNQLSAAIEMARLG